MDFIHFNMMFLFEMSYCFLMRQTMNMSQNYNKYTISKAINNIN